MWERKKNRKKLNIFLSIIIVIMLAGMVYGYIQITAIQKKQDSELIALANEANKVSEEQKQASYEDLEREYKNDLDTVSQYMPGIVCYGDILTEGTSSGISYPKTLQNLINKNIVNQYSFKSTLENPYIYTRIDWSSYTCEIPVVNLGTGNETTYTVMGRAGADPFVLDSDIVIPADCTPVEVTLESESGKEVEPLVGGDGGINPVTINGIEGTLSCSTEVQYSWDYSYYKFVKYYTFTRSEPGDETEAEKGSVINTYASTAYSDYIHVVFVGTFGEYSDAKELCQQIKSILGNQTSNSGRYIVLGPYYKEGKEESFYKQVDTELSLEFGQNYINIRKYLMNEAMSDLDYDLTEDDEARLSSDKIPSSLLVDTSKYELKGSVYELIGNLVYDRMDSLGYFDEIRQELCISEIIE